MNVQEAMVSLEIHAASTLAKRMAAYDEAVQAVAEGGVDHAPMLSALLMAGKTLKDLEVDALKVQRKAAEMKAIEHLQEQAQQAGNDEERQRFWKLRDCFRHRGRALGQAGNFIGTVR